MNDFFRTLRLALSVCAVPAVCTWAAANADSYLPSTTPPTRISSIVVEREHVVHLDQQNRFAGRVVAIDAQSKRQSPLSEIDVHFVLSGTIVQSVLTDADGRFVASNLTPGAYSFAAASGKGFVVFGLLIKPYEEGAASDIEFVAPAVSPRFRALKSIFGKYLGTNPVETLPEPAVPTSDAPAKGRKELVRGANQVVLVDGKVSGQLGTVVVGQPVAGTHIALVQNDRIVKETECDENGNYEFDDVDPGVYDFIAAGQYGCAAVGVEVLGTNQADLQGQEEVHTSLHGPYSGLTLPKAPASNLDVALSPSSDGTTIMDMVDFAYDAVGGEVVSADPFVSGSPIEAMGQPVGMGGAGGSYGYGYDPGYFGGGGGYGGFGGFYGGLSNLAELALAGWIIAELIDSDNNNNIPNPPPISPNN